MIPIGKFFCGFLVSSAVVETASKPMYAKKIINAKNKILKMYPQAEPEDVIAFCVLAESQKQDPFELLQKKLKGGSADCIIRSKRLREKQLRGGKFEPRDILEFFMGPAGWINMGIRKARQRKMEKLQKELDALDEEFKSTGKNKGKGSFGKGRRKRHPTKGAGLISDLLLKVPYKVGKAGIKGIKWLIEKNKNKKK